jgi:hypothetical protein
MCLVKIYLFIYTKFYVIYNTSVRVEILNLHFIGPDIKTNWPTDRRSQYNLNLDMKDRLAD